MNDDFKPETEVKVKKENVINVNYNVFVMLRFPFFSAT